MQQKLLASLIASRNESADDVLLEALRRGDITERSLALDALLKRKTPTGIFGVLKGMPEMSHQLRLTAVQRWAEVVGLVPEAGRSQDMALRMSAIHYIALARLGKLCYVLTENAHHASPAVSSGAIDALVSLSRHVASSTRRLQSGRLEAAERQAEYEHLLEIRAEVEASVYRTLDTHKGDKIHDLIRAALLVCDHPGSKTLSILSTSKHGGVSPFIKRLQQTPDADHVDAFLLGATHGQLRSQFAVAFSHIEQSHVLDGLLRRTYLLKDYRLELCMKQVTRGAWWSDGQLGRELEHREGRDAARIADWLAVSGTHDVVQDEKLVRLYEKVKDDLAARLRLLRLIIRRPKGSSLTLLRRFLDDADETVQRMATREMVRRKPADYATALLGVLKTSPGSVRVVAARAISESVFTNFYERFDRLDAETRVRSGKAVFRMLPDALQRMGRRLRTGPVEQRLKSMAIVQELGLTDTLREDVLRLLGHESSKVRSKAVVLSGLLTETVSDVLLDKALSDPDGRVRANAIEVLEVQGKDQYLPLLARRTRSANNRERANAIKAMSTMKLEAATPHLMLMLRDQRPEHRISGLWASRHIGLYKLLEEVVRVARTEPDPRVRRYAVASARMVAERVKAFQRTVAPAMAGLSGAPIPLPVGVTAGKALASGPTPGSAAPASTPGVIKAGTPAPSYASVTSSAKPGMARIYRPDLPPPDPERAPPPAPPARKAG